MLSRDAICLGYRRGDSFGPLTTGSLCCDHKSGHLTSRVFTTRCVYKTGSHIPPTYLRRSRRLQLTTFSDLSQWVSSSPISDESPTYSNLREIELRNFQPFYLQLWIESSYWSTLRPQMMTVHIKYFQRRQPPTTAGLPAKLNSESAQLRRQAGGQCLGQVMTRQ